MSERPEIQIVVHKREGTGKAEAGKLRRSGQVPAVLYGGGKAPVVISVEEEAVRRILKSEGGENTIFLLKLKGGKEERRAMIREIQRDPMTGSFLHMDFIRVMRGQKLNVNINVLLEGDCVGVRDGGRVDFITRELQIEVLPREMLDHITLDISDLNIGEQIKVGDLGEILPASAQFLDDENRVIVHIEAPRGDAEDEEAEEAGLGLIGEESTEPELIKKGKGEDED